MSVDPRLAHALADGESILPRQHPIERDQGRSRITGEKSIKSHTVFDAIDHISFPLEKTAEQSANLRVILDNREP